MQATFFMEHTQGGFVTIYWPNFVLNTPSSLYQCFQSFEGASVEADPVP